jgi:hypothetical protein
LGRSAAVRQVLRGRDVLVSERQLHRLTTYEDTSGAVTAGLVALALSRPGDPSLAFTADAVGAAPHPRYLCGSLEEYVARFALPRLSSGTVAGSGERTVAPVWLSSAKAGLSRRSLTAGSACAWWEGGQRGNGLFPPFFQ